MTRKFSRAGSEPKAAATRWADLASHHKVVTATRAHRRSWLARTLNGASSAAPAYEKATTLLVTISVAIHVLSGVDGFEQHANLIDRIDGAISALFLLDYAARMYTATEASRYRVLGPVRGRLRWARTWEAVVDACASFPFFVDALLGSGVTLPSLTWLRSFRLLKLVRTSQYAATFNAVTRVLYVNRQVLLVSLTLVGFMVLGTATLLYLVSDETCRAKNNLDSLPEAAYMSVLMLTGLGAPEGELTLGLRLVTVLTAFLSVPFFAIPASMLTWGFEGEAARLATRERRRFRRKRLFGAAADAQALSSSSSEASEDDLEEYLATTGGGDDDEADAEAAAEAALAVFAEKSGGERASAPLLPAARRLALKVGARRLAAARRRMLAADALTLVEKVGQLAAEGQLDDADAAERIERKLQAFAKLAKSQLAEPSSSMAEPSVSEGDAADGVRAEAEAVRAAADRLLAELARLR